MGIDIIRFLAKQNLLNRSWTKNETEEYKNMNDELLKELNATLHPSKGEKTGKIGLMTPGQIGDVAQSMGILKDIDVLFPNKEIIVFCNMPNADLFRYSNVSEVRPWPWAGNGLPEGTPDFYPMLCNSENRLNKELAANFELTKDLEDAYFPLTHQVVGEKREGLEYSLVSKKIFGIPNEWDWHPCLSWSEEEKKNVHLLASSLSPLNRVILLETFAGSGQAPFYSVETTKEIVKICREKFDGNVSFIFASHKHLGGENNCGIPNQELFGNEPDCYYAYDFTPRQIALFTRYCDLITCISSGISVTTSAWNTSPVPKIQWCGSRICSTQAIANGPFTLVESGFKTKEVAEAEFFSKLNEVLETI